ncbi:MAG: 2-oxoglutarate dehydrogenase complex dihydrolipoyllysine-residue succinyltransferase [Candidatus Methylacidiphilales bacterium]
MAIDVKVPSVGESITSGILGAWRKKQGEFVHTGDVLFEIETDKVTSEVYAEADGVLQQIAAEGSEVKVGEVVARIEESASRPSPTQEAKSAPPPAQSPKSDAPAASAPKSVSAPGSETLSPAVRRLVAESGIDPAAITGTGKGGRLTKQDVLSHLESSSQVSEPSPAPSPAPISDRPRTTRRKLTPLRRKIAERLVSAQHQAAMLTTFNEIDMTNAMALRARFQERFQAKHGVKLGFMSIFLKACVHALKRVPAINARLEEDTMVENHFYDIGVAVSTDRGLLVPVLRGVDQLSLAGIEQGIAAYAKKARDGKITIPDLEGGVFTVTNGGVFGSLLSTPILNPPQSAILGMHTIQDRPVAVQGRVEIRPMMYVALSYDHRIVDGKEAVTFLVSVKEFVEQPALGLLDLEA